MNSDTITLLIPVKAEYAGVARLTVSALASNIGFDYDAIEDIKVAVSEVLAKIVEKKPADDRISLNFDCCNNSITIRFNISDENITDIFDTDDSSFALAIIRSLMDEIDMRKKGNTIVTMKKSIGEGNLE
jgi:serine/threonine-protein kinase RsbW